MELLSKIQQKLVAPKGQYNNFGKYKYRSCEDILEAVKPLLGDAILTLTDEIVLIGERYYVKATVSLFVNANEFMSTSAYARESFDKKGMDAAQITGSASSYARKYALNGLFCIDDSRDSDNEKNDKTPEKPTTESDKILDSICKILEKKTNQKVIKKNVAALFLSELGEYPTKPETVQGAASWLINLNRQDEWTEKGDMTEIMKNIEQAFFEFETVNQDYLADNDGKLVFSKDKFIKAVTKVFKGLPFRKTVAEIAISVKPEDVAKAVKE